jgi:raffinose/stachyose/melibiose transport system substrate-binding protein
MQKYLSGESSWEEAIKNAQESWEKSRNK